MISSQEEAYIYQNAIIPEQLPHYVEAVTRAESSLFQDCLVYRRDNHITLIAYPLGWEAGKLIYDETWLAAIISEFQNEFEPQVLSVISPVTGDMFEDWVLKGEDHYHRLDLKFLKPGKKLRNIIRRAQGELTVSVGDPFDCRYKQLVNQFLKTNKVSVETRAIFKKLPRIVRNPDCVIFSAKDRRGKLVAFDVFEFGAEKTAFYLFNFFSRSNYVPGASDLLLSYGVDYARQHGKRFLNLGLGIHPGIERFKQKWGSQSFIKYFAFQKEPEIEEAVDVLYAKI